MTIKKDDKRELIELSSNDDSQQSVEEQMSEVTNNTNNTTTTAITIVANDNSFNDNHNSGNATNSIQNTASKLANMSKGQQRKAPPIGEVFQLGARQPKAAEKLQKLRRSVEADIERRKILDSMRGPVTNSNSWTSRASSPVSSRIASPRSRRGGASISSGPSPVSPTSQSAHRLHGRSPLAPPLSAQLIPGTMTSPLNAAARGYPSMFPLHGMNGSDKNQYGYYNMYLPKTADMHDLGINKQQQASSEPIRHRLHRSSSAPELPTFLTRGSTATAAATTDNNDKNTEMAWEPQSASDFMSPSMLESGDYVVIHGLIITNMGNM
ncbi:hypothetical protein BDF19DRAFT_159923 [Syncephalis fuscata]|nr:hypothetical protein BDF19DRAFT_159923 [Syncephalis fuscata]